MNIIKKILSVKKTLMALASMAVIFALTAPSVACALITDDLANAITTSLSATDTMTAPILSLKAEMIKYYLIAIIVTGATSEILAWEIKNNSDWLNLKSKYVETGWNLTRGLANMFMLIIFVVIAFGFILRIEALQPSKSLPRLIVVALLMNFSKLFVGMLVDLATITNNTIMYGHTEMVQEVMKGFLNGLYSTFVMIILDYVKDFLLAAVPFLGSTKQVVWLSSLLFKGMWLSTMSIWVFQIVAATALSMIFLLYIFLFAARVYIVQILAILSPLAFLCLILPQTVKYWDEWLKHLIQWTFVGSILLFFLMIGLSAGNSLLPNPWTLPGVTDLGNYLPVINVPKYYVFYTFLAIYMAVSFWLVDRTMPMIAVAIMGMAKSTGTKAWTWGGKGVAKNLGQRVNEETAAFNAQDKAARDGEGNLTLAGKEAMVHQAKSMIYKPVNWTHALRQTTPEMSVIGYRNAARASLEKKFGKDDDGVDRLNEVINSDPKLLRRMGASERVGLLQYGLKYKGTEFVQNMRQKGVLHQTLRDTAPYSMSDVTKAVGYDPASLQGEEGKQIAKLIVEKDSKGKANFNLAKYIHGDIGEEALNQKAALYTGAAKIMEKKETSDNWDSKVLKINPTDSPDDKASKQELQEAISYKASSAHIANIGSKHGQDVLDEIHDNFITNNKDSDAYRKFAAANPKLAEAQASQSATANIFPAPDNIAFQTDRQTGFRKKAKKEKMQEEIKAIIDEENNIRHGQGRTNPGGRRRQTGTGQQRWDNQGGGATPPPGSGPGPGAGPGPGGGEPGGATPPPGGRRGPGAGPGPEGGFGGAAGRQRANQNPRQGNLGDFNPGPGEGRDEDLRNVGNRTIFQQEEASQRDQRQTPQEDLRANDRRTSRSGRTTGVYDTGNENQGRGMGPNGNP